MNAEPMVDLLLDESKWPAWSLLAAILLVALRAARDIRSRTAYRTAIGAALSLMYGGFIGVMGSGHLLAVGIHAVRGDPMQASLWLLLPIGLVLAVPGWLLASTAAWPSHDRDSDRRRVVALNAWLGVSLVALGPHNWPLALFAGLNITYRLQSRPILGWAVVTVTVAAYGALLAGSLVFYASGQTFEQFSSQAG